MPDIKDLIDRLQREAHPTIGGKVYDPRATRPRRRLMDEAASALSRLEIENAALREALTEATGELSEAADKFWVIHCNHPGKVCGRAQEEDKQFLAEMSKRMTDASIRLRARALTKESIDAKG